MDTVRDTGTALDIQDISQPSSSAPRSFVDEVSIYLRAIPARITNSASADQAVPHITPMRHLRWAAFFYGAGLAVGWVAVLHAHPVLLMTAWCMTIHGSRKLQLNIGHACAHGRVYENSENADDAEKIENARKNELLGTIIHAAVIATAFFEYEPLHVKDHHNFHKLATEKDPTVQSLAKAGIVAGVSRQTLYKRLWIAMFSPRFHLLVFLERVESHLRVGGHYSRNFLMVIATILTLVTLTHSWVPFTLAVLVPLIWGYQTSQLLRLCVEHRMPADPHFPRPSSEMQELTDEYTFRLTSPIDLLVRGLVLTCDSVRHAHHHYDPSKGDWANYVTAGPRARDEAIKAGKPLMYHEITGFLPALDGCFTALSNTLGE